MDSLIVSLNAVLPMFLMLVVGYGLKQKGFFADGVPAQMNKLVFRLLLPVQLFKSAFRADLSEVVNARFLLWNIALTVLTYLVMAFWTRRSISSPQKRGALLQGMFRGNLALVGMSVAESLFGAENTGLMAISAALIVPLYNVLTVFALADCGGKKPTAGGLAKKIATNPLIIGCFSGLAANLAGIVLPVPVESVVNSFGGAATPVALLALGASFRFDKIGEDKGYIAVGVVTKLVLLPLVIVGIGIALGFRDVELGTMAVIHGAPVAVSSYTMAQQMGADGNLAAAMVVFTGILSCFTIFLWIFSLLQLGLI